MGIRMVYAFLVSDSHPIPCSGPHPTKPKESAATTMITTRGGGLRGFCCLGCCYAGLATGSSEVELWSGVGLMVGS